MVWPTETLIARQSGTYLRTCGCWEGRRASGWSRRPEYPKTSDFAEEKCVQSPS